jgi:hypothetical protein
MSHLNDDKSNGIRMNTPKEGEVNNTERLKEIEALNPQSPPILDFPRQKILELEAEVKKKDDRIVELTAMCYTLARRLRNESFADNITAVQRQQMAEMAMMSLQMSPQVWDLVHRSEEQQQQQ